MSDYSFDIAAAVAAAAAGSSRSPVSRCLEIDAITGDLVHDGKRLQLVADLPSIAQSLRTRLSFFKGEWFLDEEFGTPYFQTILGKQAPLPAVREVFRRIIQDTVGVLDIVKLELKQGSGSRNYVLSFRVSTDFGELRLEVPTGV